MTDDVIFSPLKIGAMEVKNRLLRSSISGRIDNYDGSGTPWRVAFERTFARGGIGAIITAHVPIHIRGRILPDYATIDCDERIPFWRQVVEEVHKHDCRLILQLSYSGRQQDIAGIENARLMPLAPTDAPEWFQGLRGKQMTTEEVTWLIARFVDAAVRAKKAGVDAIELHSGNGYLFTQFLSPAINNRTDEYGGSLENRYRFLGELIKALKGHPEAKDLPLIVKFTAVDRFNAATWPFQWSQGTVIEDSIQVAKWIEADGADAVHVTTGATFPHPWNPAGPLPPDELPRVYRSMIGNGTRTFRNFLLFRYGPTRRLVYALWHRTLRDKLNAAEPWRELEGLNLEDSRAIKQAVGIPVICTGAFQTAKGIRGGIEGGSCDAVSMARPLLANPDLPNRMRAAIDAGDRDYEPERPCTCCNKCLVNVLEHPLACYDLTRFGGDYEAMMKQVFSFFEA